MVAQFICGYGRGVVEYFPAELSRPAEGATRLHIMFYKAFPVLAPCSEPTEGSHDYSLLRFFLSFFQHQRCVTSGTVFSALFHRGHN
jgi:hypothetical protein